MAPLARLALALAVVVAAGACRPDTVRLSGRPQPGDEATYRVRVRAVAVTTIADRAPRRTVAETVVQTRHRVLESGPDGSTVQVRVTDDGGATATYVVRLDRSAQLTEVRAVEGLPSGALGDLGLAEVFPAAATAPPSRALGPGDRWDIDTPVETGSAGPSRLVGEGRLAALTVAGGRELARVDTAYRLPVWRAGADTGGRLELDGTQDTRATVAYDLADGAVESARATTTGRYTVRLLPPAGVAGEPLPGTLRLDVESRTRRIG